LIQFFLQEGDVGKNRAVATVPHLSELNEFTDVKAFTNIITDDFIVDNKYDFVVLVNYTKDKNNSLQQFM
jgi:molybdopterin/thiamine biosynthesis adenylyltransferase